MSNWVALRSLQKGQYVDGAGNVLSGRAINVYLRGTTTFPVGGVAPNSDGSGTPLTQPLATDSNGDVPGYVQSAAAIDFYDTVTDVRQPGEAISANDSSRPQFGTHAGRPAAVGNSGLLYYETDTALAFLSDGAVWNSLGARNLISATNTSTSTITSTTGQDVSGLNVTVTVGPRPIMVIFDADSLAGLASGTNIVVRIMEGATILAQTQFSALGTLVGAPAHREAGPLTLASGSTHTYKINALVSSGTGYVVASATSPALIRVMEV